LNSLQETCPPPFLPKSSSDSRNGEIFQESSVYKLIHILFSYYKETDWNFIRRERQIAGDSLKKEKL
jgi:hypothetical protein